MIARLMPPLAAAALFLAAPAFATSALAADPAAGKAKASGMCVVCHGMDGLSQNPEAPNLAGQVEMYLAKSLEDFRAGRRQNEMMSVVAKGLSDDDIANLAAWYASIEISVKAK